VFTVGFGLLGPLEARVNDREVPLAGPKQRLALAHLLLEANRVVSADRLIDAIWGDDAPDDPRGALQVYVSRLRSGLGEGRLEARPPGYILHAKRDEIDAFRFEDLVAEARRLLPANPARAAEIFDEALGLWRGTPLADLAGERSVEAAITRLTELRLAALEDQVEARLACGEHDAVIADLEALLVDEPLREHLWGQLMIALYRSGRQADALAAYRRLRKSLADELGLDPSAEIERLQVRILNQDPALDQPSRPVRGYELMERIGQGAFGTVFRGLQPEIGREVAVKVIHERLAGDPEFIRRFEREARLVARLEHPHIVPLYDFWRDPSGAYLAMRFLRGGNLAQRLSTQGPFSPDAAARLVDQIAQALDVAHRQGIVHRDVRPPNVLFDETGNAYLTDFGIAREMAQVVLLDAASSGLAYYLSPEEIRGEAITPAADVYSLGLVVYEALVGRHPFADTPSSEVVERHLRGDIPPLGRARPDLPVGVGSVIARAAARDPRARYATAPGLAASLRAALGLPAEPAAVGVVEPTNPYKGLRAFEEADLDDFFGRDLLVARLVERLREPGARFLALVGPSGSGKSSIVGAGLVPAIRRGDLPGSDAWFVVEVHPGASPFRALEQALLRVAAKRPADLRRELQTDPAGLARMAEAILPGDGTELLIVIDQFEELFTLTQAEDERAAFLEMIRSSALAAASRVRIVVTLRADFYDRPLLYTAFGDLLGERTQTVTPLSAEELERAIVGPAERVGLRVEPRLVAELVTDAAGRPAALPLLEFALTELFEHRVARTLTLDAYRHMGGLVGAIGGRAEEVFRRLDPSGREAARQLFLRLVAIDDDGTETRRRVLRSELASLPLDGEAMAYAIDVFSKHRLLSFDRDPTSRVPTVEMTHEALLREWPRLRGWIESARDEVRTHRRLAAAVSEWEAADRAPGFLLGGARLDLFEAWRDSTGIALAAAERAYIEASLTLREAEGALEQAREARERALERRSLVRTRALAAVLAAATLIAFGLTYVAVDQGRRAEAEARVAAARELAAAARGNLELDPEVSILLALEAVRTTQSVDGSVLPEAEEILHRSLVASRIDATMPGVGHIVDWSRTGLLASAAAEERGSVEIREASSGRLLRTWQASESDVSDVVFSPDGSVLATAAGDGAIRLWNPDTGGQIRMLEGPMADVRGISFSQDGGRVAGLWWDGTDSEARVYETGTGRPVGTIDGLAAPPDEAASPEPAQATGLSPDGSRLAVALSVRSVVEVYDLETGRLSATLPAIFWSINDVDWSPDGDWLAASGQSSEVFLYNASTGDLIDTLYGHTSAIVRADWAADSRRLVTASVDGTAKVWEVDSSAGRILLTLAGHGRPLTAAAFAPDGTRIVTADVAATAKVWEVGASGDAEWMNLPAEGNWFGDVAFTPDGRWLLGSAPDGKVGVWDATTGEEVRVLAGHDPVPNYGTPGVATIAVSPDGRLAATGGRDDAVKVWTLATGELVYSFEGHRGGQFHWLEEVVFSADGSLLATASQDGTSRILEAATGRELRSVPHASTAWSHIAPAAAQFTPDGRWLITGSWDGLLRLWDPQAGTIVREVSAGSSIQALAVDPTGRRVAVATVGGTAGIWDLETGTELGRLVGHSAPVKSIAFGPDGRQVATAAEDGEIRLWDAESAVTTSILPGHAAVGGALAFSPDGSRLASIGGDWLIRVWAVDIDDLVDLAEEELTRSLTDDECRQYLHVEACSAPTPG
jgi:WD40 repeat protein/DNA-binding SARP family transcriptional activator